MKSGQHNSDKQLSDGSEARFTLLVTALFLASTVQAALLVLLQLYLGDLTDRHLLISLATSFRFLGVLVGSVLWGHLFDAYSGRSLLICMMLVGCSAVCVLSLRPPTAAVLVLSFLIALILSGLSPVTCALGVGSSGPKTRGRRVSLFSSARSLGLLVGGTSGGVLLYALGYTWSFALLSMVPLIAVFLLVRVRPPDAMRKPRQRPHLRYLLGSNLRWLYLGVVFHQMSTAGSLSLVLVYMFQMGISPAMIGAISASRFLFEVLSMYPAGRLADRIGRQAVFAVGFGFSAIAPVFFALSSNVLGLASGFLFMGLGFGALHVGSVAYIGDTVPHEWHGVSLGLFESIRALGGVSGPILAGAIASFLGYKEMFLVMFALAVIGVVVVAGVFRGGSVSH